MFNDHKTEHILDTTLSVLMSIKILMHLKKETGSLWNIKGCDNGYPNKCVVTRPGNGIWLGCNSNSHVTFFDKNLVF